MFNLPVNRYNIDPTSYDKDQIISSIEKNFKLDPKRNGAPDLGSLHQSLYNDDEGFEIPNYDVVSRQYSYVIDNYFKDLGMVGCKYRFNVANYTCISEHTNMRSHFHTVADFAAVHYIQFDEKTHTPTRFLNPFVWNDYFKFVRPELFKIFSNPSAENSWMYDWWECDIKEDDIVFFPAMLKHEVLTQKRGDRNRITIALNIEVLP